MGLAITVLLTGIIVVFSVLVLLTLIIKLYGTIITKLQNNNSRTKKDTSKLPTSSDNEIDDEIVAVISAAVASMYSDGHVYKIKNIKQIFNDRPAWGMASIAENTKPF